MKYTIEKANQKDTDEIVILWKKLMDFHKDLNPYDIDKDADKIFTKFLLKNIRSKKSIVLKAIIGKKIIGYCLAYTEKFPPVFIKKEHGYISDAFIEKEYRNHGIMQSMVFEIAEFFRQKGIHELWLRCYSNNESGVLSWKNIGFEEKMKFMNMEI
jgi:ribosomal protein S18 acetylase RimI-like enzyme